MAQNVDEMKFCRKCKMNVFPTRPKFNVKVFGFFAIILLIFFSIFTLIFLSIFSGIFLFIFFMWGFMLINPYVIYYRLKKKENCPRCFQEVQEKNIAYKPFGDKEPEIYKVLTPSKKSILKLYCPYCGILVQGQFCKSCGKKMELQR